MNTNDYLPLINPLQNLLSLLNQRPLLCYNRPPLCAGCEPGQIFECGECGLLVPWCMGADGDYAELCDKCAFIAMN